MTTLREEFEKLPGCEVPDGVEWCPANENYLLNDYDKRFDTALIATAEKYNERFSGFCLGWAARAKADVGICEAEAAKYSLDGDMWAACLDCAAAIKQDIQE